MLDSLANQLGIAVAALAFANPLMPAGVSLGHFWGVSISNGIFGAPCAWFVPQKVKSLIT